MSKRNQRRGKIDTGREVVPLPAPFRPTFTRHIAVSDTYSTYRWSHDFKEPRGGNYDTDHRIIISIQSLAIVKEPRRWLNESVELKKKRRRKWKYTKCSHAEAEGEMEGQIERGEDYFQFWQWNFCQNCWLLVSRSREPWQCLVSSLVLAWSCWIGICVVKLSISLCFFIIVFIVSTLQPFLFFFSFSFVLSFIRFVVPFVVLIVRCIIEFLIGIFHCFHYMGRVRHFHFSYLPRDSD